MLCRRPPIRGSLLFGFIKAVGMRGTMLSGHQRCHVNLVLSYLAIESRTINAEQLCCRLLVTARALKRFLDYQPFDVLQRHVRRHIPSDACRGSLRKRSIIKGQINRFNLVAFSQQYSSLDNVLQLADVAGPPMPKKPLVSRLRYTAYYAIVFLRIHVQKVFSQQLYVLTSVAERRDVDSDCGNAVKEIVPQQAIPNRVGWRTVG